MKKKILISAVIIILILVLIPTIAYFSLKNKDLRKWVSEKIESATGTVVSMDSYDLSFPAKIQVHNLKLKTPDGIEVTADKVAVHPAILKLITGTLYLKTVSITGADITIPLDREKKAETAKKPEKTNAEKNETGNLPLGTLEIRDAVFHITHNKEKTTISGIHVSLKPGVGFELAMSPGDTANSLKLTGTLGGGDELKTLAGTLKIAKIQPLLKLLPKENVPIQNLAGNARFKLEKITDGFTFNVNYTFPTLDVSLDGNKLAYPMKGKISGHASPDFSKIILKDSVFTIRATTLHMKGGILPETAVQFTGNKLGLQDLVKLIPPSQSPFPPDTEFQGTLNLSGTAGANGIVTELKIRGAHVQPAGMAPLELNGKLRVTEKQIKIVSLLLTNPETDLTIDGTIDQYLSDHGTTNLKIRGKMLNFAKKTQKNSEKQQKTTENDKKTNKIAKNEPILVSYPDFEGMTHHIDCQIGAIILPGLTLSNLKAVLTAGDTGTFLKKCSGTTLDGTFSVSGKLLPQGKGIKFSANGRAKKLKLTGILSDKLPVKGGRLAGAFSLSGNGADSESIKQKTNGTVTFNISDATLRDTPALEKIEQLTGMKFIGKKLRQFKGEAGIRDGKAIIKNTRMSAAGIQADLSGTISLNGELDLKTPVQLSAGEGKKLPAKLRLLESNGKITLPLEIKGTTEKPKVKIDMKNAKKAARKKLKKKLLNRLFGN